MKYLLKMTLLLLMRQPSLSQRRVEGLVPRYPRHRGPADNARGWLELIGQARRELAYGAQRKPSSGSGVFTTSGVAWAPIQRVFFSGHRPAHACGGPASACPGR
jgi:hypothetical protein